jgi:hypothetical protein
MRHFLLIPMSMCFALAACADRSGGNTTGATQDPTSTADGSGGKAADPLAKGPDTADIPVVVDESGALPQPDQPQPNYPLDGTDGTDGGGGDLGGQPVPEPGTLLLVGTGLAGVALLRRRRRVQAAS